MKITLRLLYNLGKKAPYFPGPVFPRDLSEAIKIFNFCFSQLLSKYILI